MPKHTRALVNGIEDAHVPSCNWCNAGNVADSCNVPPPRRTRSATCPVCEAAPVEIIKAVDDAGVPSWHLATACTRCLAAGGVVYVKASKANTALLAPENFDWRCERCQLPLAPRNCLACEGKYKLDSNGYEESCGRCGNTGRDPLCPDCAGGLKAGGVPCDACEGTGNGQIHGVDDYCGKCDATGWADSSQ